MKKSLINKLNADRRHYLEINNKDKSYKNIYSYNYKYNEYCVYLSPYRMYVTKECYDYEFADEIPQFLKDFINKCSHAQHLLVPLKINKNDLEEKYKEVKILEGDFWAETYKVKTPYGYMGFNIKILRDLLNGYDIDTIYMTDIISPVFTTDNLNGEFGILMPKRVRNLK